MSIFCHTEKYADIIKNSLCRKAQGVFLFVRDYPLIFVIVGMPLLSMTTEKTSVDVSETIAVKVNSPVEDVTNIALPSSFVTASIVASSTRKTSGFHYEQC